jgi:hypothetical protein
MRATAKNFMGKAVDGGFETSYLAITDHSRTVFYHS